MKSAVIALTTAFAIAAPAAAQDQAVTLFARGGGFNALTDLNDAGSADFKKVGYNVGAGIAVQLHRYVSLRADGTFSRNELQLGGIETGDELSRVFYTGAVQLQYPSASGVEPYLFAGAGGVTLHEIGTDENTNKPAGTFGVGFKYAIPNSRFGLFLEGQGWVFELNELNGPLSDYDKTQLETGWSGGFSYQLPF